MAFWNFKKNQEPQKPQNDPSHQIFSTPFAKIGNADLSRPFVSTYYNANGYVRFGTNNDYPQVLVQLYYQSPLHGAIIDFITDSVIGGGYTWKDDKATVKQTVEVLAFEKRTDFKALAESLTKDYIMHRRIAVKVNRSEKGTVNIKRMDPSYVRNYPDLTCFACSPDWSRGNVDAKDYKAYDKALDESLYVYQESSPGQDVYPIPTYNSCLNACYLDSEIMFFHKNNIQNSVFPSIVIRRPKEFGSQDEIAKFKSEISSKTGASNAGKILVLSGNGFDDTPEATTISTNNNDKLFSETVSNIEDQICKAHKINPLLMGIKTPGSLGNSQELEFSYLIYEKVVVMPLRRTIAEILNALVDICGVKATLEISNYQIIEKQIQKQPGQ